MSSQFVQVINLIAAKKHLGYGLDMNAKMRDVMLAVNHSGEEGITTREVANKCDLSVYSARNWLMKLEKEGVIVKKERPRNSTWHHA